MRFFVERVKGKMRVEERERAGREAEKSHFFFFLLPLVFDGVFSFCFDPIDNNSNNQLLCRARSVAISLQAGSTRRVR